MVSTAETQADSGRAEAPEGGEVVGVPSIGETDRRPGAAFGQGRTVTREAAKLGGELVRVALGRSEVEPGKGDRRFTDPAWSGNPIFSRIERGYLATAQAVSNVVGELGQGSDDQRRAEQARFATTILTSALAPTNFFATNPAAIKRAFDTGGKSLVRGVRNFVGDVRNNGGMPSMVERDAFEVGKDLALSPGAVVHRDEVGELIQYQPSTERVQQRPLVSSRRRSAASTSSTCARAAASSSTPPARASRCSCSAGATPPPRRRVGPRHLRHPRARRDRRRARDLRQPRRQHDGLLRGRHHHHHAAQPPRRDRRRPRAQHVLRGHAARLRRARPDLGASKAPGCCASPRPLAALGDHHQQPDGRRVHLDAPRRPGLQLLGQQLPDGRQAAGVRHPGLERRRHQPPRRAARRSSSTSSRATCSPSPAAFRVLGTPDAARRGSRCPRSSPAPWSTTSPRGWAATAPPRCSAAKHVRAELLRAHREPGQPARQPEGALLDRRRTRARPAEVARRGDQAPGQLVGGLDRVVQPHGGEQEEGAALAGQQGPPGRRPGARAATCTAETCPSSRSSGTGRRRSAPPTTTRCPPPGRSSPRLVGRGARPPRAAEPEVVAGTLRRQRHTASLFMAAAGYPGPCGTDKRWDEFDHLALLHRYVDAGADRARAAGLAGVPTPPRRGPGGVDAATAAGRASPPTRSPPCTTWRSGCRRAATRSSSAPAG